MYGNRKKKIGASNTIFGVLFYWHFSDNGYGKRKDSGKYINEPGAGGKFFGRGLEQKGIIHAVFVEAGDGSVFTYAAHLYNNAFMGLSGATCVDGIWQRCIIKIVLSLVWSKRHGTYVCSRFAALSVLFYGIWTAILEFWKEPVASKEKLFAGFSGCDSCHNGDYFGKLCKSIFSERISENIFLEAFYNIWYLVKYIMPTCCGNS